MSDTSNINSEQTFEALLSFPNNSIQASLVLSPDSKNATISLPISIQASLSLSENFLLKSSKDVENINKNLLDASEKILDNFSKASAFFSSATECQKEVSSLISKNLLSASILIASSLRECRKLLIDDPVEGSKFLADKLVQATELVFKSNNTFQAQPDSSTESLKVKKTIPIAKVKPLVPVQKSYPDGRAPTARPVSSPNITSTLAANIQSSTSTRSTVPSSTPSVSSSTSTLISDLRLTAVLNSLQRPSLTASSTPNQPFQFSNRSNLDSFDFLHDILGDHRSNSFQSRSSNQTFGVSDMCQHCNIRRVSEFSNFTLHLVNCLRRKYPQGSFPHSQCRCGYWMPTHIPDGQRVFHNHAARCRR